MKKPHEKAKPAVEETIEEKPAVVTPAPEKNPASIPEPVKPVEKPVDPVVGPTAHGEAAQRFVNKTSRHSERVQSGMPRAHHERYEHPERHA